MGITKRIQMENAEVETLVHEISEHDNEVTPEELGRAFDLEKKMDTQGYLTDEEVQEIRTIHAKAVA